jgi:hypothetical protein
VVIYNYREDKTMPSTIIHNSKKYSLVEYENEKQLEDFAIINADYIFGKSSCFLSTKKRIGKSTGALSIPDGYLLDLSFHENPKLYYIEIELSIHSLSKHVVPQLAKFHSASENTKQKIKETVIEAINSNEEHKKRLRIFFDKSKKFENINQLVDYLVFKTEVEAIIIIDYKDEYIKEILSIIKVKTHVIEFNTFEKDGEYVFNFEAFQDDIIESDPVVNDLDLIDTIVVAAREEGFQSAFINENRWYAVRISEKIKDKIKFIAIYQKSPIKMITHYAEVENIEEFEGTGKYVLYFKEKGKELSNKLGLGLGDNRGFLQAPRYTTLQKIKTAKFATDLWKK